MAPQKLHVLVIGAGPVGLLIAQGLTKAGASCTVYERQTFEVYTNITRMWTMALHWGTDAVLSCLPTELANNLQQAQTNHWSPVDPADARALPVLNGKTGEYVTKTCAPNTRRVARHKLCKLFGTGLDVRYGHCLTGLRVEGEKVKAVFNDGAVEVTADAVIGADGSRSAVRGFLADPESRELDRLPHTVTTVAQSYTEEQARFLRSKMNPIANLAPHPDQETLLFFTIADVPNPEKPETWRFHLALSVWSEEDNQPATNEERMKRFKSYASNYVEPFRSAALWVDDDTYLPQESYGQWLKITPWNNHGGRITLAGDAAHPMTPFRAQGLNNGFEDARLYVEVLKRVLTGEQDLKSAVDQYDADTYARGKEAIFNSNKQAYAMHHWEELLNSPVMSRGLTKDEYTR